MLAENNTEDLITDMVAMVYSLTARLLDNVGQKAKWNASSGNCRQRSMKRHEAR